MNQPIFKTTEQAVHVAYLIEHLPATQASVMQSIYEAGMGRAASNRTINTDGLSAIEFRAQCATIVKKISAELRMPQELAAIQSVYGYQLVKARGVRGIVEYIEPMIDYGGMALLATAWNVFAKGEERKGLTVREISDEFAIDKSKVNRAALKIKKTAFELKDRAISRLDTLFKSGGLVGDFV